MSIAKKVSLNYYFYGWKSFSEKFRWFLILTLTPIKAMGCLQCLPLSIVQLKGKLCRNPHCCNGVEDTFGLIEWTVSKTLIWSLIIIQRDQKGSLEMEKVSWCHRFAIVDFWQARLPQWQQHGWHAATAVAAFFSAQSRQDCGLGGFTSCGCPAFQVVSLAMNQN